MDLNKDTAYKSGDLVYCDVLEVAKHEWEFGTTYGRLRGHRIYHRYMAMDHVYCYRGSENTKGSKALYSIPRHHDKGAVFWH